MFGKCICITQTDKLLATSWILALSSLYSNTEHGNKSGKLVSCYAVWKPRTQNYVNPVCINTLLRINELDFTVVVFKVALSSCFQSNELLLKSNYNNTSVCEPWIWHASSSTRPVDIYLIYYRALFVLLSIHPDNKPRDGKGSLLPVSIKTSAQYVRMTQYTYNFTGFERLCHIWNHSMCFV